MGFGFNLGFIYIVIPATIFLLILGVLSKKQTYFKLLGCLWIPLGCLMGLTLLISIFPDQTILEKKDYYGMYIIDRNFYPGKQADWQYNHFKLEITKKDSIFLYKMHKKKVVTIAKGSITTVKPYSSERLVLHMAAPNHHITATNPTTFRKTKDNFYLVFHSDKFKNLFFRKGTWKKIN